MLDSPFRVTFDTNPDNCNLHCDMCEGHSTQYGNARTGSHRRIMPISTVEKVLNDLRNCPPMEIIPSTMGEPLLYDGFGKLIELCKARGIKLNLTTNGTFPGGGVERWAEELLTVCSDIKVSFNGVTKATYESIMQGSDFDSAVANLKCLAETRHQLRERGQSCCSLTLQPTFRERNLREMPVLVSFAITLGFDRVKGHHLWVHGEGMANESLLRNEDSRRRWNGVSEMCFLVALSNLMFGNRIRLENFEPLPVEAMCDEVPSELVCPFLGREMWVNSHGRFEVCCAPDDLRRTLGDFGNVLDSSVLDLWHSSDYSDLCSSYNTRKVCKSCLLRRSPK